MLRERDKHERGRESQRKLTGTLLQFTIFSPICIIDSEERAICRLLRTRAHRHFQLASVPIIDRRESMPFPPREHSKSRSLDSRL